MPSTSLCAYILVVSRGGETLHSVYKDTHHHHYFLSLCHLSLFSARSRTGVRANLQLASLSGLPSAKIGLCNDGNSKQVGPMASAFWPVSFRLECAVWSDLSHGVTAGTSQKTVMGCRRNFANFMSRDKGKGKP